MKRNQSVAKKAMQFNASQYNRHEKSRPPARAHHSRSSSCSIWVKNPVSRVDDSIITPSTMGITRTTNLCPITRCQRLTSINLGLRRNVHPASNKAASAATNKGARNDQTTRPQASRLVPSCLLKVVGFLPSLCQSWRRRTRDIAKGGTVV